MTIGTATTADQNQHKNWNQNDSSKMALEEEMQQWEDEQYAVEYK